MTKTFLQNLSGVSTVRISAAHVHSLSVLDAAHTKREVIDVLNAGGYNIRQGTSGDNIQLAGNNGVQTHIRQSDAYVFFGNPSLVELFKLASLFVGLQTLDPDLHYKPEQLQGQQLRRPVIIYGDHKHFMPLFNFAMHLHTEMKTVRQDPASLVRFAANPTELETALNQQVIAESSIHGEGADHAQIAAAIAHYTENTFFDCHFTTPEPKFKVVTYTSASRETTEAHALGAELAKAGIGVISGAGQSGSMGAIARGTHSVGGWASGTNCAHIAAQEGLPQGMIIKIMPDIYSRMADMKQTGNAIICGAGGYGGMGTVQEMLAAVFLLMNRHQLMTNGRNGKARSKPIIFDNSRGLWNCLEPLLAPFGVHEGQHYVMADSTDKVLRAAIAARDGKLELNHSRTATVLALR